MNDIVWCNESEARQIEQTGGKGANLAEMISLGLPVPRAFTVTANAYQRFIENAGIADKLATTLDGLDPDNDNELQEAANRCQDLITSVDMPDALAREIQDAYQELSQDDPDAVAIRSSATAEDLPEASFAGQQETYLHVSGASDVLDHVQRCWASLFTPRAIYYRVDRGFDHEEVLMAVIVQRMVDADAAGVLFTRHPTTGEKTPIVEAAWGLGEGVVSGTVSPDNYVLTPDGDIQEETIAEKKTQFTRGDDGGVHQTAVPSERREQRVLSKTQLEKLARLATTLEDHYEAPQDVEWAFEDDKLHLLQTRPITTIQEPKNETGSTMNTANEGPGDLLIEGLGAAPGTGSGEVALLDDASDLDRCDQGDVLVTPMTTPDMVPAMKRASAIVTDEGGMTSHAAIVSRELGLPCVVGTKEATKTLDEGQPITVDGDNGRITSGRTEQEPDPEPDPTTRPQAAPAPPATATRVKVNVSMPEATERAAATRAEGVGLLRVEHIVLGLGEHPMEMIDNDRGDAFVDYLTDGIRTVADAFAPDPVWVRTLDAPTDEFRSMPGGDREPHEANPMLGFRGVRRGLREPRLLRHEFRAIRRLHEEGLTNVGVMLPLVHHPREIREAKKLAREEGLDPDGDAFEFGIMIEVPAAGLLIDEMIQEGLDFVSFGTNDLTQYTLAVDRNNENVADLFDEFHPAVGRLIEHVIKTCRREGVETSICGQAGSDPDFVAKLVEWGISSVSSNIDAVQRVQRTIAREEQRLLLDAARDDADSPFNASP